jgi:hypothetical protein
MRDQHRDYIGCDCNARKVRRKIVLVGDGVKGRIEDAAAFQGICRGRFTDPTGLSAFLAPE